MKQLLKFLTLNHSDRLFLINTFLLLGLVRLGLWLLPYDRLQKILTKIGDRAAKNQTVIELDKIVKAVNISSCQILGGTKCLARALTAQVLMKRHGYSPQLCIGVAKGRQEQLEAHAWIEHQGEVVIGYLHDLSRYTPMSSLKKLSI